MAEPHWTSYVAIGTGIFGAIMGYIAYRKSNRLKALDLRLELRKAVSDVHTDLSQLRGLIEKANNSRKSVLAARGMSQSSIMEKWDNEIKADRAKIVEISNRAPNPDSNYHIMSEKGLESELIIVHQIQGQIRTIQDKYREAIRSDEEENKQIREDHRAWLSPRP